MLCDSQDGRAPWSQKNTDSVLEEDFWWFLAGTNLGHAGAESQARIGRYRVDALIDCDGDKVVVELDGKAFHDKAKDAVRDSEIIKSVDAIIRIPFAAIHYCHHATFRVLEAWYPRFATRRDMRVIELGDFMSELESDDFCHLGISREQYADECGYQIYRAFENEGLAASARSIVRGYAVDRITIRRREIGR